MTNTAQMEKRSMNTHPIAETLKTVLASSYMLYLKTQNYHWNVTGPNFASLHAMFEQQYNDLFTAVDELAERIRALGEFAPGTFTAFESLSRIKEGDETLSAEKMVAELASDQEVMVEILRDSIGQAAEAGDEATAGMLTDRLTIHEKTHWMLKSSM